jgi:riboflavin kinase/FMN adenylyltransferase
MNLPAQFDGVTAAKLPAGPLHLAIGMFDGVHLGHRAVIAPAIRAANEQGGVAAALTFQPHPSSLFRPDQPTRLIQDRQTKAHVLGSLGIKAVITERFTAEFAQIEAEQFVPWLKRNLPSLAAVYVGDNFRFGYKRRGTVEMLAASGRSLEIDVFSAGRVSVHGETVSSTRIRAHLEAGEIAAANALLGYPYFADGVIAPGKKLGRVIGFPTLNLPWAPDLSPRFGVYAVRVSGPKAVGRSIPGVANYGLRPTVETASEPRLEIHLLDACPFDAGDEVTAEWLHFVRPEQKFGKLSELRAQIARDCEEAKAFFG